MFKSLFPLAVQSTLRKKRTSGMVFAVLLLSFSCAIMSLSLTESMHSTNERLRLDTYGEWYLAIPDGMDGDAEWLAQQDWASSAGSCRAYGFVAHTRFTLGSVDGDYFDLSRAEMLAGRLPRSDDEVAVPEELLTERGMTEYQIGQKITFSFSAYYRGEDQLAISGANTYTLCGVFRENTALWHLGYNKKENRPVTVILTDNAARLAYETLDTAANRVNGKHLQQPSQQFYAFAERDARTEAINATKKYMQSTRDFVTQDVQPSVNLAAYPNEEAAVSGNTLYSVLIAAVAMVAVLCVYLMQLPAEVHSFAVLRSIGITKGQLLVLMLLEALLLAIPAVLLGIPLGAGLTWLALRAIAFSGSVIVQVSIPYDALKLLLALWPTVILTVRLVIFFVTVRTPLTGRMQLSQRRARRAGRSRGALIALLLTAFCAVLLYVVPKAANTYRWLDHTRAGLGYTVHNYGLGMQNTTVPEDFCRELEKIPGVQRVEGEMELYYEKVLPEDELLAISFEGFEERTVNFRMVDYNAWADTLRLSEEDAQRFVHGDIVLLGFASEDDIDVLPTGDITVHALDANGNCVGEALATPLVWLDPKGFLFTRANLTRYDAYCIICSKAYLDKLTSSFDASTKWNGYAAGDTSGYACVRITPDSNADDLSTAYAVKALCQENGLLFTGLLEANVQRVQDYTQELILLLACGGCVALVTLFLLTGTFAIETEQERRSYTILRVIGMSLRQMHNRVLGKALRRSVFAIVAGWTLVAALDMWTRMRAFDKTLGEVFARSVKATLLLNDSATYMTILFAAILAVLLSVSLFAKRGLKQTTLLK